VRLQAVQNAGLASGSFIYVHFDRCIMLDLDDPIAKREKQEAQGFMCASSDNPLFPKQSDEPKECKNEINDLLSVLDTFDVKSKKKYKE
jgi:hypothetical protein